VLSKPVPPFIALSGRRDGRRLFSRAHATGVKSNESKLVTIRSGAAMNPPSPKEQKTHWKPSPTLLNVMTALIGIGTLCAGIGWLVYSWYVDLEVPYFAIPLVMCVPVIVAVAFRNMFD
jgi:hypothetical protein